jgi:hypothetical protein
MPPSNVNKICEPHLFDAVLSSTSKIELMKVVDDETARLASRFVAIAQIPRLRTSEVEGMAAAMRPKPT